MDTYVLTQLDRRLASIQQRVQSLKQLSLAAEAERRKALDESRHLLAALAWYRHELEHALSNPTTLRRHAA